MVASGIPVSLALAALIAALAPVTAATGVRGTMTGAYAMAIGGVAVSVFGLALLRSAPNRRPRLAPLGGTTRGAMTIPVTRRA